MTATPDLNPTSPPSAYPSEGGAAEPTPSENRFKLSIVVPVYNEAATLHELVRRVVRAPLPGGIAPAEREIICVDDASTDGLSARLDELPGLFPGEAIRVIHKPVNQGKGAALRDGFAAASGEFVLVQDADLEYDPGDYPKLLQPMVDGQADVVYGSRFIGEPHRVLYFWHTVGNKLLTFLSNVFTNLNLTDMEVGYKAFRRSVLRRITLKCGRFGFEPEVTAKIARLRPPLRIYEVGVAYHGRGYEEGKKITWVDGIKAVLTIIRFRFEK